MSKKGIISGAIILTIAGIITRILGFVYRIYMSNIIGAEGMGLYQLIMPIYTLAWSIACSGFTTTVSKLVASERAKGEYGNIRRVLKQSVVISGAIGIVLSALIYSLAEPAAVLIFKDTRTVLSLQILAFAIPFMAFGSVIRGYFFGLQETLVPAINQVFEQVVRMAVVFLLAGYFIPLGLEFACGLAVLGIVAEEVVSLIYIVFAYKRFKLTDYVDKKPSLSRFQSLSLILTMALPLTATRVIGSFLGTLENILIPGRLQQFGMTGKEAISVFGQISGMAMPLIFFPSAFLLSLSISLVPAVSEASAVKNHARIKYTAAKSLLFAAVIGFFAAAIFVAYGKELGMAIYNQNIGEMLLLLGIMCPFMYMQVVLSGILNGLGFQVFIFRNSLISSVINIFFIYFLVPKYGINAFILGWFASLIVVCALEINKLKDSVELNFEFANWFFKPIISAAAATLFVRVLSNRFIFSALGTTWGLAASITLIGLIYMVFIVLTGCIHSDDIQEVLKFKKKST